MSFLFYRRFFYYVLVLAWGVLVHQGFVADLLGSEGTDLVRRNSEAYALMWFPLYWDIFMPASDPDGLGQEWIVGGRDRIRQQALWFILLGGITTVVQFGAVRPDRGILPNALSTLGEAFVAAMIVSFYLAWSRGLLRSTQFLSTGRAVVPARSRVRYYAAVVMVAFVADQGWVGGDFGMWLEINSEAYAAMLLIPAYFDSIAPSPSRIVRLGWYAALLIVPVAVQGGVVDPVLPGALVDWVQTTTEAFLATLVISLYFDVLRGRGHWRSSASSQAPDSVSDEAV